MYVNKNIVSEVLDSEFDIEVETFVILDSWAESVRKYKAI
jgi:hypothetical protein